MLRKKIMVLILSVVIIATSNIFVTPNYVQAVTIKKEYINNNRPGTSLQPVGIVIHATDEPGGTAQNNRDYFNRDASAQASAHYFVDWNEAIQTIPENEVAWHAGPTANHKFLSVEMCEPYAGNQSEFNQVYENTVELVSSICKRYGWGASDIHSHKWVSETYGETDHTDPIEYLSEYGKSWDKLVSDIQNAINGTSSGNNSGGDSGNNQPPQNPSGSISDLQTILNNNGYGHLTVDNQPGAATIAACPLLRNGSSGDVVKWVQKRLGISADGIFGNDTKQAVINFQKTNGLDADGIIGKMTWTKLLSAANGNTTNPSGGNTQPTQNVSGDVADLQTILNNSGYGHLTVDNEVGPATIAACPLLENGSKGDVVKWVQKKLGLNADGIFGNDTKQAVINFQKTNGLDADGEIGKMTWTKLLTSKSGNSTTGGSTTGGSGQTTPQVPSGSVGELQTILNKNGSNLTVNNEADAATIAACPLLRNGSSGDVVKWVQKRLGISADGIFGNDTKQAVINFQKTNGLDADGEIGKATWTKLLNAANGNTTNPTGGNTQPTKNVSGDVADLQTILNNSGYGHLTVDNEVGPATIAACPLLKNGSSGDVVKWVQKKLGIGADGIFGSGTKQAVINFQRANGLDADGIIGKGTWTKLLSK
ncbi:N-acetylmuramoyl-L-alanine amidase [Clostridium neuense]|uniref:N-acetylmuramoyl-L-alanine amidase n=1 Tax=Clostridium neuense TaxID=1728934 RepID=A0ABW8TKZ0_9CLOT